jgi:3-methyladenine DNA glycosylase AlkC
MAEPLKTFFSPEIVRRLAAELARVDRTFPARAFIQQATSGLEELELLARGRHIALALGAHLPRSYPEAIELLLRSLGPEHATEELLGLGMAPFFYLPHVLFVAERGLEHFELSMRAQYELTKRFSAEGSIRPYIASEPERTFAVLRKWASDDNAHVRRLVSEGTRLRLPWAARVEWLDRNPRRVLELLETLKDDSSTLVRRSVANNLNDLGKVHPKLLIETCAAWLEGASAERRALIDHALRSAIKRAEPGALGLLGFGKKPSVTIEDAHFQPKEVVIGGRVVVRFTLCSTTRNGQNLLVDLAVHFVKANGKGAPKVFKLRRVELPGGGRIDFVTHVSLEVHTTRTPHPGRHVVEVLVNGQAIRAGSFTVVRAAPASTPRAARPGRPRRTRRT